VPGIIVPGIVVSGTVVSGMLVPVSVPAVSPADTACDVNEPAMTIAPTSAPAKKLDRTLVRAAVALLEPRVAGPWRRVWWFIGVVQAAGWRS
jgi:hypothetical protein